MATDFRTIERLLQLAKKYKIAEMNLEDGKFKIHFKTARAMSSTAAAGPVAYVTERPHLPEKGESRPSAAEPSGSSRVTDTSVAKSQDDSKYHKVISPFVGTFYRAPSPEAESYVKEGQVVRKGDVLCIVEAMKLMNEIESEVSGKVVSCLVENGQPVEYGEPLFMVDPL